MDSEYSQEFYDWLSSYTNTPNWFLLFMSLTILHVIWKQSKGK